MKRSERLAEIGELWSACERCPLSKTRANVVTHRGSPRARLFVIGEAPGADEDASGKPFVGLAGRKLDELFREAGLDPKKDVFVANMVGCRPPGNRKPERDELAACRRRLNSMVKVVRPGALLLLGATAAKLAGITAITAWRGRVVEVEYDWLGDLTVPAIATFHPSYLNRLGGRKDIRDLIVGDIKRASELAHVRP